MLLLVVLVVFPMLFGLAASLFRLDLGTFREFVGFKNYETLLANPATWKAFLISAQIVVISMTVELTIAIALAVLVNREMSRLRPVIRTALLIPMLTAPVVAAVVFRVMLDAQFGVLPLLADAQGFSAVSTDPWALISVALVNAWLWMPFMFVILLAALQSIPASSLEAASLDGASAWQQIRHIEIPQIAGAIAIALVLRFMDALRVFDLIFIMTQAGPGTSTKDISYSIFDLGIRFFRIEDAAAFSWLVVIALTIFMSIAFPRLNRRFDLI